MKILKLIMFITPVCVLFLVENIIVVRHKALAKWGGTKGGIPWGDTEVEPRGNTLVLLLPYCVVSIVLAIRFRRRRGWGVGAAVGYPAFEALLCWKQKFPQRYNY